MNSPSTFDESAPRHFAVRLWAEFVILRLGLPAAIWVAAKLIKLSIPAATHGSPGERFLWWIAGPAIAEWLFVLGVVFILRQRQVSRPEAGAGLAQRSRLPSWRARDRGRSPKTPRMARVGRSPASVAGRWRRLLSRISRAQPGAVHCGTLVHRSARERDLLLYRRWRRATSCLTGWDPSRLRCAGQPGQTTPLASRPEFPYDPAHRWN